MKALTIIARSLLGLIFVVFGSNAFLQFIPMPPPDGLAGDFMKALFASHYYYVVAVLQIAGGALCLIGRFVPLGLTLLGPVIVNALLFHLPSARRLASGRHRRCTRAVSAVGKPECICRFDQAVRLSDERSAYEKVDSHQSKF